MLIYLRKLFLIPWTLWCGISFLIINALFFPVLFIFLATGNATLYRWAHHIPSIIARISLLLWGIIVKVESRETIDSSKQYIFVGNHRSMLDPLISGGFILNPKKFIGKAEVLRWPFLGYIHKRLYIPVKREDKASREWSKLQLIEKMKEGFSMVVFSEGKTNVTDEPLLPFKDGAFMTSCVTQVPIVPFVIFNADKLWHRNKLTISPGILEIKFLPILQALPHTDGNIELLKNQTFEYIKTELMNQSK